jgi:hypothetical protein
MSRQLSKVFFVSIILATSLAACGGGGDSAGTTTSGGSNQSPGVNGTGSTNTLSTLDLKSVEGAQNASAIASSFLTIFGFTSGSAAQIFSTPSANFESSCSGGGKSIYSLVNPDGKPTLGDSIKTDNIACVTKDAAGTSTENGTTTLTLSSLSGDLIQASAVSSGGFEVKANATEIFDTTVSGVRYQGQIASNATGQTTTSHDGKGTTSTADDIDSVTSSIQGTSSGTVNGQTLAATVNISSICSKSAANITTCTAATATSKGSSILLGNYDITLSLVTALVFDSNEIPTAGSFKIQQGSDVVTVSFSVVAGVSQARITNAAGNVSTVPWSTLSTLSERVPF